MIKGIMNVCMTVEIWDDIKIYIYICDLYMLQIKENGYDGNEVASIMFFIILWYHVDSIVNLNYILYA